MANKVLTTAQFFIMLTKFAAEVLRGELNMGLLPLVVVNDRGEVISVTCCDSIAGGTSEVEGMPAQLSLVRGRRGDSESTYAVYRLDEDSVTWKKNAKGVF